MIRRLLVILVAVTVAFCLSPVPASAIPYAPHSYRLCIDHHGPTHFNSEHPEVCMTVTIVRQTDGVGWFVQRIYLRAYNDDPAGERDCFAGDGLFEQPLAVNVEDLSISGTNNANVTTTFWTRNAPNLTMNNNCKVIHWPEQNVGTNQASIYFRYEAKLQAAFDSTRVMSLVIRPSYFSCSSQVEECTQLS